jgi:hypothetical protein
MTNLKCALVFELINSGAIERDDAQVSEIFIETENDCFAQEFPVARSNIGRMITDDCNEDIFQYEHGL